MDDRSPAQVYALVFGAILVLAGILGFFYEASFKTGDDTGYDELLGVLGVNGWHNVVHILSGVVGLAVAGSYSGARTYALAFGAVYIALGLIGMIFLDNPDLLLDIIPLNTEDNVFHLLTGVAGVAAGLLTPAAPEPSTAPR